MIDEESVVNIEPVTESDSETEQTETVEVIYTEQLKTIQDYQSLQIGLECILIGVLLMFSVFNVLKRYF